MQNYKKFMAKVNERIEKRNKKPVRSDGIVSRKERDNTDKTEDFVDEVTYYISAIRKATQKLKVKQNGS